MVSKGRSAMDVLFVDLPFTTYELGRRFKSAWSYKQFLSPHELHLGFRYMVSSLRSRGYTADILFPSMENGLTSRTDLLHAILEIQPLILGFTSYEGSLKESFQFIGRLKSKGIRSVVCMGGHLATFSFEEILRDFHNLVDVIVLGEGEQTILDLVRAVSTGQGVRQIAGVAYHDGSQVLTTRQRAIESDINRLPFPLMDIQGEWAHREIPLFATTSRGCYGQCSFCRSSHFGERWRARDPKNIVDEVEQAHQAGVSVIEFVDDNFLGPGDKGKARAVAVAAELKNRGLRIRFHVSCRVNDVEESTMRALKDAGLISVSLGVESGVQRILDTFNKNIFVQESVAALELLNRLEIPSLVYIIFFDPYMTLEEARENLEFLKTLRALENVRFEEIIFRKLIPISGTTLFEKIRSDGLIRGDYLRGHYFVFKDRSVSLLADFMETIDLRFERIFQREEFRKIPHLYGSFKEFFEFSIAEKAIEMLGSARLKKADARARLDGLLSSELRSVFGSRLSKTGTTS